MAVVRTSYYPAFDYLRIALALIVTAEHAGLAKWPHAGNFSVQIFFAMSGWLIGGILLRSEIADLPHFYFNRATRIWIPYFVAIAIIAAVSFLKENPNPKWAEIFFYFGTFSYNFFGSPQTLTHLHEMPLSATGAHFWSICAEEQFYLFAPFLVTVPKIGRTIVFWIFVSTFALISQYSGYFAAIALGVLSAVGRFKLGDWQTEYQSPLLVLTAVALFGVFSTAFPYVISAPFCAIGIVLLLAHAGSPTSFSLFLGGLSYPLYLNHWLGIFIANGLFKRIGLRETLFSQLGSVLIALIIASVLFLTIDRPVMRYRDKWFNVPRGQLVAVVGFSMILAGFVVGIALSD